MPALRETTKKKIFESLEKTYFTASSFSIQFNETEDPFMIITFMSEKKFSFSVSEAPGYNTSGYITDEAPGMHIETGEKYKYENLTSVLKAIGPWTERILEDYRSKNPVVDEFEVFRKTLSEQMDQHIQDKNAHFSEEEANSLRARLDDLSARLHEVLQKSETTEYKLNEVKQEIDRIKNDIALFPKGVWYQVAGSKVVGVMKTVFGTAEGRQFALEAAKKFFLEGSK